MIANSNLTTNTSNGNVSVSVERQQNGERAGDKADMKMMNPKMSKALSTSAKR
jgi:hypothetical protein